MLLAKNQNVTLNIESLSNDGNGVGRCEGQVVFVPASAVGDLLDVRIVKTAKNHAFGIISQIITPSPSRIKPDCKAYPVCGGCSFRHIDYNSELKSKQGFVEDAVRHIGKINSAVSDIIGSPDIDGYRNKVQYPVATSADGEIEYGFYAQRSHRIVSENNCKLQPEIVNKIAFRTASLLEEHGIQAYNETEATGLIRHIYIRHGYNTGQIMVCLVSSKGKIPAVEEIADTLMQEFEQIKTFVININTSKGNRILGDKNIIISGCGYIEEIICGVPLKLDVFSFSQVNTPGAEQLFGVVQKYADAKNTDTVLDLYCGSGVIGLSIAHMCSRLIGVEIIKQSIESAKQIAAKMNLADKCTFLCENAASAAQRLQQDGLKPDIVIVDPPRKGCDKETIDAIGMMQPSKIVMVSCNAPTMARDLALLVSYGYDVKAIQPVDMFPRTRHVECVCLLEL